MRTRLSSDAGAVHALLIKYAKRAETNGGLRDMSDPDADELRLAMTNLSQGGLDGASQLDEHGTLEFWAATYSVQAYALRDYCALYTDLHQLLEQRQAQRGGVVVHVEEETGAVRRAAQRVTR